jgi:NADPH2:quinone reductase
MDRLTSSAIEAAHCGTVRAVWLREFGGPEALVASEAPDPMPGPGQVLVEVEFANVTFVETQMRNGLPGPFRPELPMIPGNGVGGVAAGRRVVGSTGGSGGYAELAAVDERLLYDVPEELALDEAVALLADGRTATMLVRAAGIRDGETVLVEAAAGGVGSLLVQLARAAGATVVAAAGGERKLKLARELGAAVAVDYRAPGWAGALRQIGSRSSGGTGAPPEIGSRSPGGAGAPPEIGSRSPAGASALPEIDVVFDGVGGAVAREAFGLLARGGRMVSYGLASGKWADITDDEAEARGVTLVRPPRPTPEQQRVLTESALAEAAAGRLRPVIGQRFPLERAADAHAAIESRATIGKTLLEVRRSTQGGAADRAGDRR